MADKEGFGFLYPKKDRKPNQPHLTGNVIVNGRMIELAAWKRTAKSGVPFLSLKGQDQGEAELETVETPNTDTTEDDPLPF